MKKPSLIHALAILILCASMLIGCRRNLGGDIPVYTGEGSDAVIGLPQPGADQAAEGGEPVVVDPATLDTTTGGDQPLESPGEGSAETQPEGTTEQVAEDSAVVEESTVLEESTSEDTGGEAATEDNSAESPAPAEEETVDTTTDVAAEQATIIHTVQQGETVGRIAEQYGVSIDDILVANDLYYENLISIGQELVIEAGAAANAPVDNNANTVEQTQPTQYDPNNYFIHTVGYGDTLFVIGQRYGFTVEDLAAYNGLTDINRIDLNQQILIPIR